LVFEAYVEKKAIEKAEDFFSKAAERGLEAMGLLVGRVFSWRGAQYVVVEDFITARNRASAVSVRFSEDAFGELVEKTVGKTSERTADKAARQKRIFVGWAHSHPGYGCFLSSTDVETQRKYFPAPFHVALVVDPLKEDGGGLVKMFYKTRESGYREASFAVVDRSERGQHG